MRENIYADYLLSFCQGKGQRRATAVHIVDAVILGGKDVRNMHYHERYCDNTYINCGRERDRHN